ncbi:MAG: class I SAM-dependent methyltransferase, partial [Candidatus Omnitrophica bacterium]|nr:class I SAM-dependent methyltransferase [Candidatus Omnitrophota bacterium]
MKILDVGCSKNKMKGAIGLDINKESHADIVCDLEKIFPIKDNSFDRVYCKHLLEHLKDPESVIREIYRVSKDGGRVTLEVPHFSSHIAYSDLTHKRYFSYVMLNKLVGIVPHKTV